MIIAIGSDHAGYPLKDQIKQFLQGEGFQVKDFGAENKVDSVDYPDFAQTVADSIASNESDRGILMCGSGVGISIAANKVPGIRCALCHNVLIARLSREHNNSNVLALGTWFTPFEHAREIINVWLNTEYTAGRHQRRLDKIKELEDKNA